MQSNIERYEENVIDLSELWAVLVKRKSTIISITAIMTLLAVVYVLVAQPIYEVKSNVMVGYLGKDKDGKRADIAEPAVIAKRLNVVFNVEDELKVDEFVSKVSSVAINKKLQNFITIRTEAISNEEALKKNREVVKYMQGLYQSKIDRYVLNTDNSIKATEVKRKNLENLETKNLKREIKLFETQSIVKIDEKIKRLKNQDIKNLKRQIKLLKTQNIVKIEERIKRLKNQDIKNLKRQIKLLEIQNIVKIDERIKFYKTTKLNATNEKIKFHTSKLVEYIKAVNQIYQNNQQIKDSTTLTISSLQMVNYQNLILNSQNKVEDLKIEIENINNEIIPNLQRDKKNIKDVNIKDLQLKIDNIYNVTILNLQRDKNNIQNDTLRKLEYKLNVELLYKKVKLNEQIEQLKYNKSEQNIQNSKVIGEFVIKDSPLKPKKKLIVVIAFVTGLILSIFLVFFLEFIGSSRREEV